MGSVPQHMNESHIALVPKQEGPEKMSHFCPIALCNVTVKPIKKFLTNRLKPLMTKLVGENQTIFILGRQASNNMVVVQELIHGN